MKSTFAFAGIAVLSACLGMASAAPPTTNVNVANTSANPVPVAVQRDLAYDGTFFSVTKPGGTDPVLVVPAGVVLTSAHVTFSVPGNIPNAAALYIHVGAKALVYQLVSNATFSAGVDLGSGIPSNGDVAVELSCYNIDGNHCQGAIMWYGYRP